MSVTHSRVALITGITGQDGAYLAQHLIEQGYSVHGIMRRASTPNTWRLEYFFGQDKALWPLNLHYGDLTDTLSLVRLIEKIKPDEIYNLAAQSHVGVSFENPEYTADTDAVGTLRVLEAVRLCSKDSEIKIYQASTSELYGLVQEVPQTETTPFYPRSPYGVAKLYGFWITKNYREAYGMFACNGILFNHESPLRGEEFVTRKITSGLARVKLGLQEKISLGNLGALRDWGHARDYVRMQWLMLQQPEPRDYVIATGRQSSVRDFVTMTCAALGMPLQWGGEGRDEKGFSDGRIIVDIDEAFYRPAEVDTLLGDPSAAKSDLGWEPTTSLEDLVQEMVEYDLSLARRGA